MKAKKVLIFLMTALVIFAQGLYFNEQWLALLLVMTVGLTGLLLDRGGFEWHWNPLTLLLVSNLFLDILGYLWYLEKGMLVFACLKDLAFLIFYMLLAQLPPYVLTFIKKTFVFWMAVVSAITVFAYMTGMADSLHYVINGRASGPLQYANTFGILLVASILMVLTLEIGKVWCNLGLMVLGLALILTMSRAVYLIALVVIIAYMLVGKPAIGTYLSMAASLVIGFLVLRFFDDSSTAARLAEGAGASEWHSRLLYYKDAIRMILDRPFGYGYNGYHYAQSFYQTGSTYHVKFVHSGLLQAFLDRGILGGILLSLFMGTAVFFQKGGPVLSLICMALLGHSLVDMNLQFPVVWLLLILLYVEKGKGKKVMVRINSWVLVPAGTLLLLGILIFGASLSYSMGSYRTAIDQYPYFTEAYRQLLKDKEAPELEPYAERLYDLNPYVTEGYRSLARKAEAEGDYSNALEWYRKLVHYSPLLIENHETYSHGLILAATYYKAYGQEDRALEAIAEILTIPGNLAKLAKERHSDYNVKHKPDLRMTASLMKDYEEAAYLKSLIEGVK